MPSLRNVHKLLDPEIRAKNLRALRWELRGLWWDFTRPAVPDPVFVVGCSRSGTTITYETLAAAPQFLKFGWEIPQFWDSLYGPLNNGWDSEAAGAEHAQHHQRQNKQQQGAAGLTRRPIQEAHRCTVVGHECFRQRTRAPHRVGRQTEIRDQQ